MNLHEVHNRSLAAELEATHRLIDETDDVAARAMSHYRWERRGVLGRLVRTPIASAPAAERAPVEARDGRRAA